MEPCKESMEILIRRMIVKLLFEIFMDLTKFLDRGTNIRAVDDVNLDTFAHSR